MIYKQPRWGPARKAISCPESAYVSKNGKWGPSGAGRERNPSRKAICLIDESLGWVFLTQISIFIFFLHTEPRFVVWLRWFFGGHAVSMWSECLPGFLAQLAVFFALARWSSLLPRNRVKNCSIRDRICEPAEDLWAGEAGLGLLTLK